MGVAMGRFDLVTRGNSLAFCEYVVKCLVGVSIGYLLMKTFPRESGQYYWLLISVVLSITHDNNSKVALDRMRGNVIGSLVGFAVFLLHRPPNLLTISIGVAISVTVCFALDLISVCRTALVGFIIVIMYEGEHGSWTGAIYRMLGVVLGCTLGLAINYTFSKLTSPMFQRLAAAATPEDSGSE
jgi:uncharacterized membrane protein YgaE (UPF0421/DUF939 family)